MTAQQKQTVLGWITTAILIPLFTWAAIRYDATNVSRALYERDQAVIAGKLEVIERKMDRVLDVACDGRRQQVRACQ